MTISYTAKETVSKMSCANNPQKFSSFIDLQCYQ